MDFKEFSTLLSSKFELNALEHSATGRTKEILRGNILAIQRQLGADPNYEPYMARIALAF